MGETLLIKNIINRVFFARVRNLTKNWEQKRKSSITGGGFSIIGNSLSGNSFGIGVIAGSFVNEMVQMGNFGWKMTKLIILYFADSSHF